MQKGDAIIFRGDLWHSGYSAESLTTTFFGYIDKRYRVARTTASSPDDFPGLTKHETVTHTEEWITTHFDSREKKPKRVATAQTESKWYTTSCSVCVGGCVCARVYNVNLSG